MTNLVIVAIVFAAAFVQSLSGFGFAALIMPLITFAVGLTTAAPLVALAGLTVYSINLIRYRQAIDAGEVVRLAGASLPGVPIGIWVLGNVDEAVVKLVLGLILIAYALYALLRPSAPRALSRRWVYPTGFIAGCLGGAYNTPGPPAIIYGQLRQWPKDEFRAVLQALFLANGVMVVASHLIARHITHSVLTLYAYAAPALVLGIVTGSRVDGKVDGSRFRTLVTVLILLLGLLLVINPQRN
jgi:uncharacterized membrane protein YfcA